MPNLIQPSFAGGEISPSLYGRVDIARYGTSLKRCKNFIVRPYGGVDNRPGLRFVAEAADSTKPVRLIPFEVSSEISYVIELGHEYMRFIFRGAQVESGGNPVEVAAPWTEDEIWDVKFTQSADVMYLVHGNHAPRELRRLTATSFELREFTPRNGPFRAINSDEALKVTASAVEGIVTVEANFDLFTSDMVGTLIYMEAKDLTQTRPWEPGERNIVLGIQRRSDGKTYRVSAIPAGTPTWKQTGASKPVHEFGKVWDGPGDTRTSGTDTYTTGVEWEYLHSGYGIVQITGYVSATEVTGIVTKRLPDSVVGGTVAPSTTWNLVGDGTTKQFTIAGAVSVSQSDYSVTIDGVPVQPNPFYESPPGIGGGGRPGGGWTGGGGSYVP